MKFEMITQYKLHTCLTFLAFEKDKYELEEHMLKSKMK